MWVCLLATGRSGRLPETLGLMDGLAAVVRQLAERREREATGDQTCGSRAPNASLADRLMTAAMRDIVVLEDLTDRLVIVSSWDELIA